MENELDFSPKVKAKLLAEELGFRETKTDLFEKQIGEIRAYIDFRKSEKGQRYAYNGDVSVSPEKVHDLVAFKKKRDEIFEGKVIEFGGVKVSVEGKKEAEVVAKGKKESTPVLKKEIREMKPQPRGGVYRVGGKEEPDAWLVRQWANEANVSTEIIESRQTDHEAFVVVRAKRRDGVYIDAEVWHDFSAIRELMLFELIERWRKDGKNPIEGYDENGKPILKDEAIRELYKRFVRFRVFALRDAITKAERIAILKILNKEWREPEEIEAEMMEVRSVSEGVEPD